MSSCPERTASEPSNILNWRRQGDRLTTSGQPSEAQLGAIRALGVAYVVNLALHTHEKALADEAETVASLGMTYIHIPVQFDNPTEADYQRFRDAMGEIGNQPVHVHCIMNFRVTAFLYRYQREELGVDGAEARARMESVWRPGGVWAALIGEAAASAGPHRYAGIDY